MMILGSKRIFTVSLMLMMTLAGFAAGNEAVAEIEAPAGAVSPEPPAAEEPGSEVPQSAMNDQNANSVLISNAEMESLLFADVMVVTASRHKQKLSEVPGSVTIITAREIQQRGALTVKELLLNFAGAEFEYDGIFETLRFRGIEANNNNKVLFLINGRKINTPDIGDFEVNFGFNLDNIKQIEVVKGPGSALYGANAFAGIINIITKDGKDINGLATTASVGSKSQDKQLSQYYLLTYGKQQGDWDYVVNASYWRQFGFDPVNTDKPNDLYQGEKAEVALKFKDSLGLNFGYHKTGNPLYAYASNPNPRNELSLAFLDAKYAWQLNEASQLSFRLEDTYYLGRKSWRTTFDIQRVKIGTLADIPPGAMLIVDESGAMTPAAAAVGGYYLGLNDAMRLSSGTSVVETVSEGPMNEALAEIQYDLAWPENNYAIVGASFTSAFAKQEYYPGETVSDSNYAGYIQDEYHLLESLMLLGGARFDYNTAYGSSFSPRGSLIYSPLPGLRAKLLYGTAFRKPDFMELKVAGDYGYYEAKGNPDLKPEKIASGEAGLEYEQENWLQLKGRYFYWETQDEIQMAYEYKPLYIYTPDLSLLNPMLPSMPGLFYSQALNSGTSSLSWSNANSRIGHGLELETHCQPLPFLKLAANYSLVDLYSRNTPEFRTWAEGFGQLLNGLIGFDYQKLFFANLYAHFAKFPKMIGINSSSQKLADFASVDSRWVWQYDFSAGVNYHGLNLTFLVLNILENPVAIDTTTNDFFKGFRNLRLNAMYTMSF